MAIPHKERLATLHAICLQISRQSLFRIFPHASCVHIFRDISGKYSKIHKGFSPFFPSSLKKSDNAICIRQIRNRLVIFHKNAREYIKYSLRFLFHLTKNLTTHLSHNLCAVLPYVYYSTKFGKMQIIILTYAGFHIIIYLYFCKGECICQIMLFYRSF